VQTDLLHSVGDVGLCECQVLQSSCNAPELRGVLNGRHRVPCQLRLEVDWRCCHRRCHHCRCSCQAGEAAPKATTVERTVFCWSRTPSEQQLDQRCPGGFPPSWYPPRCGGWRRWCRRTTKKRSWSPWSRKTWIRGPASWRRPAVRDRWRRPAPHQGADGRPRRDDARWQPSPQQLRQRRPGRRATA
jgi:hypothetical protein